MKKIKLIAWVVLLFSVLTSCKEEVLPTEKEVKYNDDVTLQFNNTFGKTPIVLGQTQDMSSNGQTYRFDELKYIISNIRFVNDEGGEVGYHTEDLDKGAFVIDHSNPESCSLRLKQIPQDGYTKIKFGIGLKTEFNTLDQEKFPEFYNKTGGAEGNKEMKMHWYWAKGYRFLKVEGVYGSEERKLSIHLGSTLVGAGAGDHGAYKQGLDAYREIVLDLNDFKIGKEKAQLDIKTDFHRLISGKAHKITLVSGKGAQVTATPNTHSSAKMEDYLDNLGYENRGLFSTKYQKDGVDADMSNDEVIPMITRWKTVNEKINGEFRDIIAINTRGGGIYKCKKVDDETVLKEGVLDDDQKVIIDLTEFGSGEYLVEIQPLTKKASMVLYTGQINDMESDALLEIKQWGNFKRGKTTYGMLTNCSNMIITANDIPDFSEVTDMANMFYNCSSLTNIPHINEWDVSNVTNMKNMFSGAYKFNSYIGSWNTSSVTDMTRMFAQKSAEYPTKNPAEARGKFNQNIGGWDVSKVTSMEAMFRSCVDFDKDLSKWDVSKVTTMEAMFLDAESFDKNIGEWKVSKVNYMTDMFRGAKSFNQNLTWDTSNVMQFKNMFSGAKSFNQSLAKFSLKSAYRDLRGMLDNTGLSCENYDATLKAWANSDFTKKKRRKFSAKGLTYTDKTSHEILTSTDDSLGGKFWTITGDSYVTTCK